MEIILTIPVLLFSIISHEVAHGYVAWIFGDPTAKNEGRLTFNPVPHIDLMGSIILPLILIVTKSSVLFGWAKPVPVNPYNLRNPRKHHFFVSLAGISANIAIAVISAVLLGIYILIFKPAGADAIGIMLQYGILINIVLAVFNMTPIPPLDGSWVLYHLLPADLAAMYKKIFPYGFFIILLLFITNGFSFIFYIVQFLYQYVFLSGITGRIAGI